MSATDSVGDLTPTPTITLHRSRTGAAFRLDVRPDRGELLGAVARPVAGWERPSIPWTTRAAVLTIWGWDYVEEDLETIEALTAAARQAVAGAA